MRWFLAVALVAAACVPNVQGRLSVDELGDVSLGDAPRAVFDAAFVDACGEPSLADGARQAIGRRPYLQRVTAGEAAILWTERERAARNLRVTTPDGTGIADVSAELDASATIEGAQYVANVTGLEPATVYCYQLFAGSHPLTSRIGFRTAPAAGEVTRFVALGDLGTRSADQLAVLEQLQGVEADFAAITGDVAYDHGTLEQLELNFFAVYADVLRHLPVFPAIGNHDAATDDAAPYLEAFSLFHNERWYSYDWGVVHVAVVDTTAIDPEQIDWLERDLAATRQPWKVVVGHHPPFSSGRHGSNGSVRRALVPIFERHDVALVLLGHEHSYERTVPINGVTYVVTGGGGRGTRPVGVSSFTAYSVQVSHFVYAVADAQRLRLWAIDATGQTFDSLQLSR